MNSENAGNAGAGAAANEGAPEGAAGGSRGAAANKPKPIFHKGFYNLQQGHSGALAMPMSDEYKIELSACPQNTVGFYYPLTAGDETRQGQPLAFNTGMHAEMHQLKLLRLWFTALATFPPTLRRQISGALVVVHKTEGVKTPETALGILFLATYDPPPPSESAQEPAPDAEETPEAEEDGTPTTFSKLFAKQVKKIVECAAFDLRNVPVEAQTRYKKQRTQFLHESPLPLGAMSSFTEVLSEENFYNLVQMKMPEMLCARHLHSTSGATALIWENMVAMGNVRKEMESALCREEVHPVMDEFVQSSFFEQRFPDDLVEIHYEFGDDKPYIVVPWPENFTRHTHSLLTRIPLVAKPPLEPAQIKRIYEFHARGIRHMQRLPAVPTEEVLTYFMYGELFGPRPQILESLSWTRPSLPPIFYPLHNSSTQEHPNFVERFKNPEREPITSIPLLRESIRQVFHNIHVESVRPQSVSQLLDACNCNCFFTNSILAGVEDDYGEFLRSVNDVLLTTSARGMILYVVLDGLIGIVTRYSGKGLRKHMLLIGMPSCGKSAGGHLMTMGAFVKKGHFTPKWLQSAASTEWGNVRMQDEADENFRKDTGGKIARGEAGEFRTTMLQYLENSEMGRSRYSRNEDDRLCEDTAMQGGFPPCNFFIMCSNLSEGDFDDAVMSRMHVVRVYKGVLEEWHLANAPVSGREHPTTRAAKGLRFVLGAAAWLNILKEAGYFKEPDNPFLPCFTDIMRQLHKCGAPLLRGVTTEQRIKERVFKQIVSGHAAVAAVVRALAELSREREGFFGSFADQFVHNMADVMCLASRYWVADAQALVYELSANDDLFFGRTARDLVSVLRDRVLSADGFTVDPMGYVNTTYRFDFRTASGMQRLQDDVFNATFRAYDAKHLKSAFEDMQHVFPEKSASGFHAAIQKRPVLYNTQERQIGSSVHKSFLECALTHLERMLVFTLRTRVYEVAVAGGEGAARWAVDAGALLAMSRECLVQVCGEDGFLVRFDLQHAHLLHPNEDNFELDEVLDVLKEVLHVHEVPARQTDDAHTLEFAWRDFVRLRAILNEESGHIYTWLARQLPRARAYFTPPQAPNQSALDAFASCHLERYEPAYASVAFGEVWAENWNPAWNGIEFRVSLEDLAYEIWCIGRASDGGLFEKRKIVHALKMLKAVNGFECAVENDVLCFHVDALHRLAVIEEGPLGKWLNKTSGLTRAPYTFTFATIRPDNTQLTKRYNPVHVVGSRQRLKNFNPDAAAVRAAAYTEEMQAAL